MGGRARRLPSRQDDSMTDTARGHLERAIAWLDELEGDMTLPSTRMGAARAEVRHALELLAIPPREPTEEMLTAGMREVLTADIWRAMYDAALAEKEGK